MDSSNSIDVKLLTHSLYTNDHSSTSINVNNPESDKSQQDTSSIAQALQEEVDYDTVKYAREELGITDKILLKGRMSDSLIKTIN